MGYQHQGKQSHQWRRWTDKNRALIDQIGLPQFVIESRQEFEYLLMHGYSRSGLWNERPRFETSHLDSEKQIEFWSLLELYTSEFYHGETEIKRQLDGLRRFNPLQP